MDYNAFKNLAVVTEAPADAVLKRLSEDKELDALFVQALLEQSAAAEKLDKVKKAIFYGKLIPEAKAAYRRSFFRRILGLIEKPTQFVAGKTTFTQSEIDILRIAHGSIGITTEGGELTDALLPVIKGEKTELDFVNIGEEWADVQWYEAIIVSVIKLNPNVLFKSVIAKLVKRYGPKFNEYMAIHRDLVTERQVLEEFTAQAATSEQKA